MKKYIWIIFLLSVIFLAWCLPKGEENTQEQATEVAWDVSNFLEKTIEEKEKCGRWEANQQMFISYAILWTGISSEANVEYYVLANWEWMYIDKRWNISTTCGFSWLPVSIEIIKTHTGFSLVNYQVALDGSLHIISTKKMFSPQAFQKWQDHSLKANTNLSPLQRAEKYYWIPFWTGGNFACTFCDQKRYNSGYTLDSKDNTQEWYEIFTTLPQEDKYYMVFSSNWIFENHGSRDQGTGKRIFGKNDTTILVDAYPPHTYDRYIIQYLSGDTMHLTREILQK